MSVTLPRFARTPTGAIGAALLLLVVAVALIGPALAPHAPTQPLGGPYAPPSGDAPLGTDALGRDVLSRVLSGGRSVLALAAVVTALSYTIGLAIGLAAGYSRSLLDPVLMRSVDVILSFPALIFLLVVITALGTGVVSLVVGAVIVGVPPIARIMRAATQEQSVRGFVEAAIARGERTTTILRREILPNIAGVIAADIGLRMTYAVLLVASVNFLGFGLQPPTSDWGVMVSENREGISMNPWAVAAPALLIAMLCIGLNLVADSAARARDPE